MRFHINWGKAIHALLPRPGQRPTTAHSQVRDAPTWNSRAASHCEAVPAPRVVVAERWDCGGLSDDRRGLRSPSVHGKNAGGLS